MSWKNLATPFTVILVGVALIVAILATPGSQYAAGGRELRAAPAMQNQCDTYPNPDVCKTSTTSPYPNPGDETTPVTTTVTITATEPTADTQATAITPETTTPQPTVGVIEPQALPTTAAPTEETVEAETPEPQAEATSETTPTPSSDLTCVPGEAITITGYGPPRAAILLYFDQRIVGGSSIAPSGSFSIPMLVGKERPGTYSVTVRIRGSTEVLRELTCTVPAA
jgi:hypothetical protein